MPLALAGCPALLSDAWQVVPGGDDSGGAPVGFDSAPPGDERPGLVNDAGASADQATGDAPTDVAITDDPHNCGAIGHDCLGAACVAGLCAPLEIASGQPSPDGLGVDDSYVYWANAGTSPSFADGSVHRANKNGGGLTALATSQPGAGGIWLDATHVYWGDWNTGDLMIAAKDGSTGAQVFIAGTPGGPAGGLTFDTQYLYYTLANTIYRVPLDGGSSMVLATGQVHSDNLIPMTTRLYWSTYGSYVDGSDAGVWGATLDGGPTVQLGDGFGIHNIATDNASLFWASQAYQGQPGSIRAYSPIDTDFPGTERVLLDGLPNPTDLAVDGAHVYWADTAAGIVSRSDKDGSNLLVLAKGYADPGSVQVDEQYVYWCDVGVTTGQNGSVLRVAK
jgi:hypothetical protein